MALAPKSDPQRENLYWLEAEFNGWWQLSRSPRHRLYDFATEVCRYYGVEPPRVSVSQKKVSWEGDYIFGVITLYRHNWGDNCGVLLHELAHHIIDEFYEDVEQHGPEFMAIYMHLLDRFMFVSNEEFRRLAKKYKLRIGRRYRPIAFR